MIIVKIELHSAVTGAVSEIGRMYLANDGTGSGRRGNYDACVMRRGDKRPCLSWADLTSRAVKRGRIENYPRLAYSVWELVRRALESCFGRHPAYVGTPAELDDMTGDTSATFEEAWAGMEAKGYQYGGDALENVRLGWKLARTPEVL